jgi:hypothetical protein
MGTDLVIGSDTRKYPRAEKGADRADSGQRTEHKFVHKLAIHSMDLAICSDSRRWPRAESREQRAESRESTEQKEKREQTNVYLGWR